MRLTVVRLLLPLLWRVVCDEIRVGKWTWLLHQAVAAHLEPLVLPNQPCCSLASGPPKKNVSREDFDLTLIADVDDSR